MAKYTYPPTVLGKYKEQPTVVSYPSVSPHMPKDGKDLNPARPWRGPRIRSQATPSNRELPFHSGTGKGAGNILDSADWDKTAVPMDIATTRFRTPKILSDVEIGISPIGLTPEKRQVQKRVSSKPMSYEIGDQEDNG